jgi:type IV pilus assembly protein PilA
MKMKRLGKRGFTLVEIMIVVAIIALLAAIAIPNLLRARHNANEAAAIAGLKTISAASESFRAAKTPPRYPLNLGELSGERPAYIDETLGLATVAARAKQGYIYAYARRTLNTYDCTATPAEPGVTGTRVFWVDHTGVIRIDNAAGLPIQ